MGVAVVAETRRLAAILSTDVVGYSRLMGADESDRALHDELIQPTVAHHNGRIVKTTGDGLLVEFSSVVDALNCAVAFQRAMRVRNHDVSVERRIEFRAGVNLGDVIIQDDDIYGDGVNLAARLQEIASPGRVYVSGTVVEHAQSKLPHAFRDLGRRTVKNMDKAVHVFDVDLGDGESGRGASPAPQAASEHPSIAVLPFDNMSGDPEQGYFADGMSEDIITTLSKIAGLFVIARNSSFTYKGRSVKVQEVARDLGVRYVLEGSVRRAGERVRVTAQLIDAETGHHLWAERYDRALGDIFDLQDELSGEIVAALKVRLSPEEEERVARRGTDNLEAYDCTLRGRDQLSLYTEEGMAKAQEWFRRAVELDGGFARAYSGIAATYLIPWHQRWNLKPEETLDPAYEFATRAIALDDTLPLARMILSQVLLWRKQHDDAVIEARRAIDLDPNDPDGYFNLGLVLGWSGEPDEAIGLILRAQRGSPHYPPVYLWALGHAYFQARHYEDAAVALRRSTERFRDFMPNHLFAAAAYAHLGLRDEAGSAVAEVQRINPRINVSGMVGFLPYRNGEDLDHVMDGVRKAGLVD